jgi:acyl carrier protein
MSVAHEPARELLAGVLGVAPDEIGNDASMETLAKWDSLAHMRLILALEEKLGCQLDPLKLVEITTLGHIADLLGGDPAR